MKLKSALLAVLLVVGCASALAQTDVLDKVAAEVQLGKVSGPELLERYRQAIAREPQNPANYVMAAAVADLDNSEALYRKALTIAPDYLPARVGLARYYMRRYNLAAAFPVFQTLAAQIATDATLRAEAIRSAIRTHHLAEAQAWAGGDFASRVELVQALVDEKQFDDASKMLTTLGLAASDSGLVLAARGRLDYLAGQANNDKERAERGLQTLVEAWKKHPAILSFYKNFNPFPRESLVVTLTKAGRREQAAMVADSAVKSFPQEFSYHEVVWKNYFAQPKPDYAEERQRVRGEADALLQKHPASPDLLKTVAAGYEMAGAPEAAAAINRRILAEYPYSKSAQDLRRLEALKTTDLTKKAALLDRYNRDFLTFTLYNEYFKAMDERNVPPAELLRAAQTYIDNYPYTYLAVYDIGQVFVRRNIYLDQLEKWFARAEKSSAADRDDPKKLNAWDLRLIGIRGGMLVLQGRAAEAEKIIRPVIDAKAQGMSNVDWGRNKMYLADALLALGRKEEAMEMYAQGYAESQHYYTAAGDKFRKLYRELKGGDQGLDQFLEAREGMFQVAAGVGIERGTRINQPAPEFNLMNIKGERVSLASLRGKVVIINFWATWCHACIDELPHFQEYYDSVKTDPGVALFAITTDENRGLVDPFLKKRGFTFPVLFDENIRTKFGVRGIPATFIIDPQGMTRLRMIGFNQNEPLVPYLTRLVAEFRIAPGSVPAAAAAPATPSPFKAAFNSVDRMPRAGLSDDAFRAAQEKAAADAIAKLGTQAAGPDLYYLAVLETMARQSKPAIEHYKAFLAASPTDDHDSRMNLMQAKIKLRDAYLASGLNAEGEKYFAADPLDLGIFVSMEKQPERAVKIYEAYLATNPSPEMARRAKSLILYALEETDKPEEVARRLELYKPDLTANTVVNTYAALSRIYSAKGDAANADRYTGLVFEMGKTSKEGKAVDGPVAAHVEGLIRKLEESGDAARLNGFIERVRTELAGNKMVMSHLDARERQRNIMDQPAKELQIDFVLNGPKQYLADLRGRVVLLDFFAHWCGPCIAGFPGVRELQQKYESKGLTVLGVSGIYGFYMGTRGLSVEDELKRMQAEFTREYQVTWPMVFARSSKDNDASYGISYIPHLILIDRAGKVRFSVRGKGYDEALDGEIRKLLNESTQLRAAGQ